ncbi:hypothetical protein KY362_02580, partial [Candidatus Woesearchaeota archaeon]|nr:hypothetical protein [Candidatus Woesearchaeota archaeon]
EEMLAGIDAAVAEVEDAKAAIEELDEDSPNAEYNEAAKKIREAWKTAKPKLKRTVARLANARLGNIIHQTEVLEKRLYHSLDVLEEQGKDVGELEELLAEFSAKLDVAADKYNEARALWSAANTPGEVDDAAKEIHALMKEAQDALKEARDMLREIVGEIKAQNRGSLEVEDDDSDSDASEEESDDETETEEEEESEDEDACETDADCDADEFCDEGECEDLEEEDDSEDDESGEEDEDESDEEEGEETEEE